MQTLREIDEERYRGYSMAFVRRVWARRKNAEHERKVKARLANIEAQKEQARIQREKLASIAELSLPPVEIDAGEIAESTVRTLRPVLEIVREVALRRGVDYRDILGHWREKRIVSIRHEAVICAALERQDLSLPQLGRVFNRDHTSLVHVLKKYGVVRETSRPGTRS